MKNLTLADAMRMIEAAIGHTKKTAKPICCAVVDGGGHLIACHRQDGGKIGNIGIAIDKAWTAVAFKNHTEIYTPLVQPGAFAFGLQWTNNGRPCFIGGGMMIKMGEEIIGGIGVSGGMVEDDIQCCKEGLKALGF